MLSVTCCTQNYADIIGYLHFSIVKIKFIKPYRFKILVIFDYVYRIAEKFGRGDLGEYIQQAAIELGTH